MYWDDIERHAGGSHMEEIWLTHPAVREAVNRRITGSPHRWPLDWFQEAFTDRLPLAEAVTVGCGAGALERDLVKRGICRRITGIDVAGPPLERARQEAAAAGLADRISYVQADGRAFLEEREGRLDGVFFHASLHHFDRLDHLLRLAARALTPRGLFYADEYVGPSRHQWHALRLLRANLVYRALPRSVRRVWVVRAPVNVEDPTEAVASHEIVPTIHRCLNVLAQRDYGGNLLSLIYPNLKRPDAASGPREREAFQEAVRRLLRWESSSLGGGRPFFTVIVAESLGAPRPIATTTATLATTALMSQQSHETMSDTPHPGK